MRLRLRLRTALIAVALLGPPLYVAALLVRHGGWGGFRRYNAVLSDQCSATADFHQLGADNYRRHAAPGHSCMECRYYSRPIGELIAEENRLMREYQRAARWHKFLAFGYQILEVRK